MTDPIDYPARLRAIADGGEVNHGDLAGAARKIESLTEANIGLTRLSVFWRNEGVENDKARYATGQVFRLIRAARKELENEVVGEESLCVITDLLAEAETLYSATKADRAPVQFCVVTSVPGEKELLKIDRDDRVKELKAEVDRLQIAFVKLAAKKEAARG